MNFKKFSKSLEKVLAKNPEWFTTIKDCGETMKGEKIYDLVVGSHDKKAAKFFRDNTTGELQSKVTLSTGLKKTIKIRYIQGVMIRFNVPLGRNSETFEITAG